MYASRVYSHLYGLVVREQTWYTIHGLYIKMPDGPGIFAFYNWVYDAVFGLLSTAKL